VILLKLARQPGANVNARGGYGGGDVSLAVYSSMSKTASAVAFDGDVERCAYLSHTVVAESSESLDEDRDGHALHGVEVDRAPAGDRILVWL
jgi:hypothetical protein